MSPIAATAAVAPGDIVSASSCAQDSLGSTPAALTSVSVRALCDFGGRAGDLDLRFTPAPTAMEGAEGHRRVQGRRGTGYESEVLLRMQCHGVQIRGRADGFAPDACRLEEIKTHRGSLDAIRGNRRALHWAQAKLYGAMLCEQRSLPAVDIALVYLNLDTEAETPVQERFAATQLMTHAEALCRQFAAWAGQEQQRLARLDSQLAQLRFPQAAFRDGQRRFAAAIYQAARDGRALLAQAPTGIGKTIAAIFPVLKAKAGRAQDTIGKIFYLTAKTPGRTVALEALHSLRDQLPELRVVELSARERTCVYPGRACHGEACPLARGFFDRLGAARQAAADARWLDQPALARIAAEFQVCPYYLSQEMVRWADVVVADYNHYFDGSALLFAMAQEEGWRVALLVDEAHNLLDRGRSMYSCAIDGATLERASLAASPTVARLLRAVAREWALLGSGTSEIDGQAPPLQAADRFRSQVPHGLADAVHQATNACRSTSPRLRSRPWTDRCSSASSNCCNWTGSSSLSARIRCWRSPATCGTDAWRFGIWCPQSTCADAGPRRSQASPSRPR
jgi:DNA excision repair protein ERCC-2